MAQQAPAAQVVVINQNAEDPAAEQLAMILFIVGLFFGIVALINVCMHINHPSQKVRKWAKLSLIFFCIWTVRAVFVVDSSPVVA